MVTPSWTDLLTAAFPKLASEGFEIVEQPSEQYNCIAYAAGDTRQWWDHNQRHYWPAYATRSNDIESLKELFAGIGFQQCHDSGTETGYEKVALYEEQGAWKHAAVQTPSGALAQQSGPRASD